MLKLLCKGKTSLAKLTHYCILHINLSRWEIRYLARYSKLFDAINPAEMTCTAETYLLFSHHFMPVLFNHSALISLSQQCSSTSIINGMADLRCWKFDLLQGRQQRFFWRWHTNVIWSWDQQSSLIVFHLFPGSQSMTHRNPIGVEMSVAASGSIFNLWNQQCANDRDFLSTMF